MAKKKQPQDNPAPVATNSKPWTNRIVGHDEINPEQLLANPKNYRIHPREQQSAVTGSLDTIGWFDEVTVNKRTGFVVDGHLRVQLALTHRQASIPVKYLDLSEQEEDQVIMSKDYLVSMGKIDREALQSLTDVLKVEDDRILRMLETMKDQYGMHQFKQEDRIKEEKQEEIREAAISLLEKFPVEPGDVFQIGSLKYANRFHYIVCGDSRESSIVELWREASDLTPNLMVTDPPYGVEYSPSWRAERSNGGQRSAQVPGDDNASFPESYRHFKGDVAYVWHSDLTQYIIRQDLVDVGFEMRGMIIWKKTQHIFSQGHYHRYFEPCVYAVRKGRTASWYGGTKQSNVWEIAGSRYEDEAKDPDGVRIHSTRKPKECMQRPMLNHTSPGEAVYDPFLGSGTTLIAAEEAGRLCIGVELEPLFVAEALSRCHLAKLPIKLVHSRNTDAK